MGILTVKHVDSTGINRLAVRLQKLFYEVTFSQNSKVDKSKIEILVGISIFVEASKSLRRLGAQRISANLGPPGKILVGVYYTICRNVVKHLAISNLLISSSSC